MTQGQNPDLQEQVAAALDWWREAGVGYAFLDEPARWERTKEPQQQPPQQPAVGRAQAPADTEGTPEPVARFDRQALPASLDAFSQWWLAEPALAEGAISARVPPRGPQGAELMVIVPEPEHTDTDTLLGGPQGRLLEAMLSAFGVAKDRAYFASALPRHLPGADWEELSARGFGDVLAHHIALVRPKRLAVFGTTILPLVGNGPPQGPASLRIFNHEGMRVEMLACRSVPTLLEQPRWKARVWQAWLDFTG